MSPLELMSGCPQYPHTKPENSSCVPEVLPLTADRYHLPSVSCWSCIKSALPNACMYRLALECIFNFCAASSDFAKDVVVVDGRCFRYPFPHQPPAEEVDNTSNWRRSVQYMCSRSLSMMAKSLPSAISGMPQQNWANLRVDDFPARCPLQ